MATATKSWLATVTAAAAGSTWRVTSAWVEQGDGTRCAELTHVSSGKTRTIRVAEGDAPESCRDRIVGNA
jgi:endonuclease YncB( thermonuclease family)